MPKEGDMEARGASRSLAAVSDGERVRVDCILFGTLREYCESLGIHEGDTLYCRSHASSRMVLETRGGRTVLLEEDWARFVRVEPGVPAN